TVATSPRGRDGDRCRGARCRRAPRPPDDRSRSCRTGSSWPWKKRRARGDWTADMGYAAAGGQVFRALRQGVAIGLAAGMVASAATAAIAAPPSCEEIAFDGVDYT